MKIASRPAPPQYPPGFVKNCYIIPDKQQTHVPYLFRADASNVYAYLDGYMIVPLRRIPDLQKFLSTLKD